MKIGKDRIKGLVQRNIASGLAYYWEPSPAERGKKWKTLALGQDLGAAIDKARARNAEVDAWRNSGARPAHVDRYVKAQTFGAGLDRYEREKLALLSANSRRVDQTQINRLREWAGDKPIAWITRARVRVLRDALCPGGPGTPGHGVAFKTLAKGREIFRWFGDEGVFAGDNPFERFGLAKPAPRHQIWEPDARAIFARAAAIEDLPAIDFALELGCYYGQREADILGLTRTAWREITLRQLRMDTAIYDALKSDHGPDAGRVMGLYVRQGKTKRWVGVPIEGAMRDRIEAAIAAATGRSREAESIAAARIVARDAVGTPWQQRDFIDKFSIVRSRAIELARAEGNPELAERLAGLQFRDARRTCVVILGEIGMDNEAIAAITGHSMETINQILEIYMPRTETMAARGVVARIGSKPAAPEQKEQAG